MKTIKQVVALLPLAALGAVHAQESLVSGLRPYERPVGAPVIHEFAPGEGWAGRAVRGLGEPLTGVGFLKDQGAWYTPFDRPNLPGRYDIRGLHATSGKGKP